MKMLKLNHTEALAILQGKRTTWRLFDDKDLLVNDVVQLLDKSSKPDDPDEWTIIGTARLTKIVEKRLEEVTSHELSQQGYESQSAMLDAFSDFYKRSIRQDVPVKIIHFDFTESSPSTIEEDGLIATRITEAKMYADGGSRGNPGPSASGFVILDMNDQVILTKGVYLGVTTNNQAEYQAVKFGLEEALKLGVRSLYVYLDSLLVVNQMLGKFKVRNRDLWPIHAAIKDLVKQFKQVSFTHVPRELNKLADRAVNDALDNVLKK